MDLTALDEIRELLGDARTRDLLAGIATDLRRRFASGKVEDIALDAHAIISSAGMLGFLDLVDLCRAIEQTCRSGADATLLLVRLYEERRLALGQIEVLRSLAA